ncbi:MAG: glycosyltransferase [Pseudomonadota bacterium]
MQERIQVLGLCRFSYLGTGSFDRAPDLESRAALLFDEARLADRFLWFEHVCLPPLRAMEDEDFTCILLVSEGLPEAWRARLDALCAGIDQIRIVAAPPGETQDVCRAVLRAHREPKAHRVAEFRLDDDDAVSAYFVGRLRHICDRALALNDLAELIGIDCVRGIYLSQIDGELRAMPRFMSYLGVAMGVLMHPGHSKCIYDYPHHLLNQRMMTITDRHRVMFLRGIHRHNDSSDHPEPHQYQPLQPDLVDRVRKRFDVDLPAFDAALRAQM